VPSFPPPVSPTDKEGVKPVGQARPVRPVTKSAIPPIVFAHYRRAAEVGAEERTARAPVEHRSELDRRSVCRRIGKERDKLLLLDSRAELERRRNNRRQADFRTNIDEEI
jgi:hypothetical protein